MGETQLSFQQLTGQYQPRRPEETVLYQAVARNFRTLEAIAESEGKRIPKHVTDEFESFLRCGILAHGFLRVRCEDCKHEIVLAFSCKKRGFCSSCGGRRMAESAAAKSEKLTLMNPAEKIPVPKLARSLLVCSDHQIRQIESFVKNPESDAEYAFILALVLYWGITTLELTLSTINIQDGQNLWISVHRKHIGRWRKYHNREQVLKLPMTPSWLAALQKRYIQLWLKRFEQSKKSFPLQPLILSRAAKGRTNRLLHNNSILELFYEATRAATGQRIPPNVVRRTSGHIHTDHGDASRLTKLGWSKSTATDFSFLPRNYFSSTKK